MRQHWRPEEEGWAKFGKIQVDPDPSTNMVGWEYGPIVAIGSDIFKFQARKLIQDWQIFSTWDCQRVTLFGLCGWVPCCTKWIYCGAEGFSSCAGQLWRGDSLLSKGLPAGTGVKGRCKELPPKELLPLPLSHICIYIYIYLCVCAHAWLRHML